MNAEIIAIGDELTSGQRLDTNSQWLSQKLGELGVKTTFHTTVADDLNANAAVFRLAASRADIVLSTGGLGPTADDLTRQAIAQAASVPLVTNRAALEHIRAIFSRRKRPMPERNNVQALFPQKSRMIPNPHGTAPGIDLEMVRTGQPPSRVFALPGVPAEMREMWSASVQPALLEMIGPARKLIRHRQIKCFGVGESDLEQMLPDLIRRGRQPSVGITVSQATITLRVTAEGDSEQACEAAMAPTIATIHDCLGNLVFGEEADDLHHAVVRLLANQGQTLALAEWGTGGLIASWLSEVDPLRSVFVGGAVMGNAAALRAAGVSQEVVDEHGSASAEAARQMAQQCRMRFSADYGLAVGPFPSNTSDSLAGQVHLAIATEKKVTAKPAAFVGHPEILKSRTAKQALNLLRLLVHER